ncbi:chromatin complexes subunit BAP18-like [Uloborus diversus]|uniref:chromatin complexes subunit BAP18-like n=1 Tax=Uloborus diversus TaxID=327109 RepID=UPI0024099818|nr:chromatin complexes subunit BAP18-like [Uloborus diversus]
MTQAIRQTSHVVAEIFTDVGAAFTRLGELEMLLNPDVDSSYRDKVSENDIQMLRDAVKKFTDDIDNICQRIKERTLLQIRNSMKRHAYEEAGLPLRKQQIISTPKPAMDKSRTSSVISQSTAKSADITLNMLNATEQEVDVEGLTTSDKLDYDSADGP